MTEQELDALGKRVLLDALRAEWGEAANALPALELSPRYRRSMGKMLADPTRWARTRARPVWKKALQTAAAVLLTCSLALGGLLAASPTVRAAVLRWAAEWYETHVVYRYFGEFTSVEMPQYEITALPEGFTEAERIESPASVSIVYEDSDGTTIFLEYAFMAQGAATFFETEDADMFEVTVNQCKGQLFVSHVDEDFSTST